MKNHRGESRGGSRIFFRRGCTRLLFYLNTNKPHIFLSFFAEYQLYQKTAGHLGGGCAPPAPSPQIGPWSQQVYHLEPLCGFCSYFVLNAKFLRPMSCCNSTFVLFLPSSVMILLPFLSCFLFSSIRSKQLLFKLKEIVVFLN